MRGRGVVRGAALLVALAALASFAASASATQFQRPLIGTFGSVAQPSFAAIESLGIDHLTGDVLLGVKGGGTRNFGPESTFHRFHPDGTPAPFAALGSNVLDGKAGPGGKPCAEEPASCDQTPQNELIMQGPGRPSNQIAIDPTNGNIYLTQAITDVDNPLTSPGVVDIFSPDGKYLGQLTKAGTKTFHEPCGVAVDSTGAVYVTQDNTVGKFVPSGSVPLNTDLAATFRLTGAVAGGLCRLALGSGPSAGSLFLASNGEPTNARILKINTANGSFSAFALGYEGLVAVDPTSGNPIAGRREVVTEEQVATEVTEEQVATEFDSSLEVADSPLSNIVAEASGLGGIRDYAVDASGNVLVATGAASGTVRIYGHPVIAATVSTGPATDITAHEATLSGSINPKGVGVTECVFEWGTNSFTHTAPCEGTIPPPDSSDHEVHAALAGLAPNGVQYVFRLAAKNANGVTEHGSTERFTTGPLTETKPATVTGLTTATLNGMVHPEGHQYTECSFEWGLTSNANYEHTAPCDPKATEIPPDTDAHAVSAPLTKLQEATTYRFRLVAANAEEGTQTGAELTFETSGRPKIAAIRASDATQSTATIEADIDPSGFATSYRFEWGPTSSYGHLSPASFEPVGSGTSPVRVSAALSDLGTASTYHYRVIASSKAGTIVSPDQTLETLDSCGLPERRCFELVSRRDPGPIAIPGASGAIDIYFQASTSPGAAAYSVESGYPDATKGYGVLYRGSREASGWSSAQLSTPLVDQNQTREAGSISGATRWLSNDLSCGFGWSNQPLTDDPGSRFTYELGGANLYRLNPGGSLTAVTKMAPEDPENEEGVFEVLGASQDCGKVLFSTGYRYPGIPAVPTGNPPRNIYEWDAGILRNAGVVPGPSGEVVTGASGAIYNAVSEDGSRVFFSAERKASSNAAEVGKVGVFVREDGTTTRDLSLSETSTPDKRSEFQWATPDGSRVFFTAEAGLTAESSPEGTDLYEYDLERDDLTDLSVDHEAGGAKVGGFVAASEDGSHVYFLARGQFFVGKGLTKAQNENAGSFSLYGVAGGEVSFIGTVSGNTQDLRLLSEPGQRNWASFVSPDGRYLLFQTRTNLTAYDSGGAREAYLYDAEDGAEGSVVCISCRQDGLPSLPISEYAPMATFGANNLRHQPQFLTVRDGAPVAFFSSVDPLAPGAVPGQNNVYEWAHGQVFRLTSAPKDAQEIPNAGAVAAFNGVNADGADAYIFTTETLNWEDDNERLSVYDARIGGGFPEPSAPPAPCNPDEEGSCQGASQALAPTIPGAGSTTFTGPGNAKAKQVKKHKKQHKHRKKRGSKAHGKHKKAGANRRAGK